MSLGEPRGESLVERGAEQPLLGLAGDADEKGRGGRNGDFSGHVWRSC